MTLVVFLRGVNVGGHRTFKPSEFARELARHKAVNFGAAGTFIVFGKVDAKSLREEILRRLPFKPEVMIHPGRALLDLVESRPFDDFSAMKDVKPCVSVLAKAGKTGPALPLEKPAGTEWQVRIFRVEGPFVLSLRRRRGKTLVYPNEVVERSFGLPATTRDWNTITALGRALIE